MGYLEHVGTGLRPRSDVSVAPPNLLPEGSGDLVIVLGTQRAYEGDAGLARDSTTGAIRTAQARDPTH